MLGPGDGNDVRPLGEQPGERDLACGAALFRGDGLDFLDQGQVAGEVVALESRRVAPIIVGRQILEAAETPGEEAASEWAVGDEADAERPAGAEDFLLGLAAPEGVFGLKRGDGVDRMRPFQRGRRGFGGRRPCITGPASTALQPVYEAGSAGSRGSAACRTRRVHVHRDGAPGQQGGADAE